MALGDSLISALSEWYLVQLLLYYVCTCSLSCFSQKSLVTVYYNLKFSQLYKLTGLRETTLLI